MNIIESTAAYERWLNGHVDLVQKDLEHKHTLMASRREAHPFLRATFYRWLQRWPKICPELAAAPRVLAVGDLHTENYGTWRDEEGRLVWGINDFDDACDLPYTSDLVRLLASVRLATLDGEIVVKNQTASTAILEGYRASLKEGGMPFV